MMFWYGLHNRTSGLRLETPAEEKQTQQQCVVITKWVDINSEPVPAGIAAEVSSGSIQSPYV